MVDSEKARFMRISRVLFLLLVLSTPLPLHGATTAASGKPPGFTVLERTTEPLLKSDRPWEEFCLGYCQVLRIGRQWHIWYEAHDRNYRSDSDSYSCHAQSRDGIHWKKPSLGIYSYKGKKNNNILGFGTHGVSVFLDERRPRPSGSRP